MTTSRDVRARLLAALEADLVGPFYPEGQAPPAGEVLHLPPSRWYLTGFIAPEAAREIEDPTAQDELPSGIEDDDEEPQSAEPDTKQRQRYPASMGMSVLVPAATTDDHVIVRLRFAEYALEQREQEGKKRPRNVWRRVPRALEPFRVALDDPRLDGDGIPVPETPGIRIVAKIEPADAPGLPTGTRALSLFVVNRRVPRDKKNEQDVDFLFQLCMELEHPRGLVPRPNRSGEGSSHWDEQVADLQFRDHVEHAVGHGVSIEVPPEQGPIITRVATTWLPRYEVPRVRTHDEPGVETSMEKLAALADGAAARAALAPLVEAYGAWLDAQATIEVDSADRKTTQAQLLHDAQAARRRIARGIEILASDAEVLDAFKLMNEAMATAARKRSPARYETTEPAWRMFQLAFVLLNVAGLADETHPDRENVELVFFPTGGGKTEAYLGVIAFTLVLRRMRGQARPDRGLGVAVLLRYTLRLLTLDQLGRAATLICALDLIRQRMPERLGDDRLTVGLWVGRSATANTLEQLKKQVIEYKSSSSKSAVSPFPLTNCPWCNQALGKESLTLYPSPTKTEGIVVACKSWECEFSARKNARGLPVLFVDEQVYQELPAFLVATVDKFAMLPWRGETGMLFGRATARENGRFFGPLDPKPKKAQLLPEGLRPPELVVQDELHLISGPLGTMVGLYETAIEYLSTLTRPDGKSVRPKVIASTATVRRAREQIRALFGRPHHAVFPPPGIDDSETWFSTIQPKPGKEREPGRLYVGVAAQGRSLKGILLRTYLTLLCSAEKQYRDIERASPDLDPEKHPADAYMTIAGYFNSLRELGGMRRVVEDDVHTRSQQVHELRPIDHRGPHPWLAKRVVQLEPVELTSRETTAKIKESKDRLGRPHADKEHVDVLLASNMISVGVDIDRLGVMVVGGQPKTTAEYIQASSRVGRQHPGLVVTCFNVAKPRDRSHYERFAAYHASFYRFVEATSLTPFSGPALERGLAGTLVAMTRLADVAMTAPGSAMEIERYRAKLGEAAVAALSARAGAHDELDADEHERLTHEIQDWGQKLLDAWQKIVQRARVESGARRQYSRFDKDKAAGKPILSMVIDEGQEDRSPEELKFIAPTSMRDVEESVHLWLERRQLGTGGGR